MKRSAALIVIMLVMSACSSSGGSSDEPVVPDVSDEVAAEESTRRACELDPEIVTRIKRGHHRVHSEDVTIVPAEPNFWGTFDRVSHTGPWDYLQRVPLVLYGPGRIAVSGGTPVEREASIVDVYPTVAELVGLGLKARTGTPLTEALTANRPEGPPKLVVTVMWDGVGRNMLERWPGRWPQLARLARLGTSYSNATVGSSPSITPATHASLGTGAYPRSHGVTAIEYRTRGGEVRGVFEGRDPRDLKLTTYADQIDKLLDNEPRVGALVWRETHMPMMGHGSFTEGGDRDELALIGADGEVDGNPRYYRTPSYLKGLESIFDAHVEELDRADGEVDGQWRGHDIVDAFEDNPAYVRYQGDIAMRMLRKGGYGRDEVTDLFFANFKQTDIAGHHYTIDSKEVADVLEEQDQQLGRILEWLDRVVDDYVVVLSADHGHTPDPRSTNAWPISPGKFTSDAYRYFGIPSTEELFLTTAVGPFIDPEVAAEYDVTARQLARFAERYTIRDNWPADEALPEGYRNRGDERVLAAAWAKEDFPEVVACVLGG
jgi:arylsulfatase A-like enzyme